MASLSEFITYPSAPFCVTVSLVYVAAPVTDNVPVITASPVI